MKKIFVLVTIFCSILSCKDDDKKEQQKAKEAVTQAETEFSKMAGEKGIAEAFWFFADSNAVIKRGNDSLISGKEGIRNFYSAPRYAKAKVSWAPDFVGVSEEGDLAYTYGKYNWQVQDSSGKTNEFKGIFHTVWKKQKDGSWKYVWD